MEDAMEPDSAGLVAVNLHLMLMRDTTTPALMAVNYVDYLVRH